MSKIVTMTVWAVADVKEVWKFRVPDDWEPPAAPGSRDDAVAHLNPFDPDAWMDQWNDGELAGSEYVSVVNQDVTEERDRELWEVTITDEVGS